MSIRSTHSAITACLISPPPRANRSVALRSSKRAIKRQVDAVVARFDAMTDQEFRQSLINAGLITKSGKLTKPYRETN